MAPFRQILSTAVLTTLALRPAVTGQLTVTGSVMGEAGEALAGARIELVAVATGYQSGLRVLAGRAYPEPVSTAASNDAGEFVVKVPEPGMWKVVVRAPGFVPVQWFPLPLFEPAVLPPVRLFPDLGAEVEVGTAEDVPRAGTWVWAASATAPLWDAVAADGWRPEHRLGLTAEDGRLKLPRAVDERLEVTVFRSGIVAGRQTGVRRASFRLSPALGGGRRIAVRNPSGEPAAGVLVRAGDLAWPVGLTDADGHLLVALDGREPLRVWLIAPDGRGRTGLLRPAAEDGDEAAVFTLCETVSFSARVVDAVDHQPLAGAFVWLAHEPATVVRTDSRGAFELSVCEAEPFRFQVEAPGYLPQGQRVTETLLRSAQGPTVALMPGAGVSGRVVSGDGTPVSGARIEARPRFAVERPWAIRRDRADDRTVSDEAGRFHLARLFPGDEYQLRVTSRGFAPAAVTVSGLQALTVRSGVRIVLEAQRIAHGLVLDTAEQPIAGARVRIVPSSAGSPRSAVAAGGDPPLRTDAQGLFATPVLTAGKVDLAVSKEGFAPLVVRGVEIPAGTAPIDLGTLLLAPEATIAGRVTDVEGSPLAEAEVTVSKDLTQSEWVLAARSAREPQAVTGTDGTFVVGQLQAGDKVALVVRRSGYLPATVPAVEVPSPEPLGGAGASPLAIRGDRGGIKGPLVVVLKAASGLRGRVLSEQGEPISGAEVSFRSRGRGPDSEDWLGLGVGFRASALTDEVGRFEITDVVPGQAEVAITARGFRERTVEDLELVAGEIFEEVEIVLERGATLVGRVLTTAREPVAGAYLGADGAPASSSEADGAYRLAGLALGPQRILVSHRHLGRRSVEIDVAPGVNTLDVIFDQGFEVTGRVLGPAGNAVAGARVVLEAAQRPWREYRTSSDEQGSFRFAPVIDGLYHLQAEKLGIGSVRLPESVAVAGGPVADVEVSLAAGGVLRGQILGLEETDLAVVEVVAQNHGGVERPGLVDFAGRFEIRDLEAGDWQVRASLPDGSRQAVTAVTVAQGAEEAWCEIEFGADLILTGEVVSGGEGLGGAEIMLTGRSVTATRSVVTDYQGRFRMADLKPGAYRMQVTSLRYGMTRSEDLELGADRHLVIEMAAVRVGGRVVDAQSSQPLSDAMVMLERLTAEETSEAAFRIAVATTADGGFHLPQVTPGRYRLVTTKYGYAADRQILEVRPDLALDDLRVALSSTGALVLTVHPASGRRPSHALVAVLDAAGRAVYSEGRTVDGNGMARFTTIPPGSWRLLVAAPGSGSAATEISAVVPGEPIEVVLPAAGRLTVRVAELVSSELVGTLTLTAVDGRPFHSLAAGSVVQQWPVAGGHATVEAVPAGLWTVQVRTPDGLVWSGRISTAPGGETRVACSGGACFADSSPTTSL